MPDFRVRQNSYEDYSEGQDRPGRINKRAELVVVDWYTQMCLDGRTFAVQIGTVDAAGGVNSTGTAPADTLVWAVTDAAVGTVVIPVWAQVAIETWTTALLLNFMLESDMGKLRYSSGGTAFVPLNLRGDSPRTSANVSRVNTGTAAGVVTSAKSTIGGVDGSHEFYTNAIEVNLGDEADAATNAGMQWQAKDSGQIEVIDGPGAFLFHLAASVDVTATGGYHFVELPTESVT